MNKCFVWFTVKNAGTNGIEGFTRRIMAKENWNSSVGVTASKCPISASA